MAEREPPMRPDQLRSLSGRPRPPPDPSCPLAVLVSASSITCMSSVQLIGSFHMIASLDQVPG